MTAAVAILLKATLAEERETSDVTLACRQDGDLNIGVFVTASGLAAIGIEPADVDTAAEPIPAPRASKRENVVLLLSRGEGATFGEIVAATDWLPHTTRAALTGLRKRGHSIERSRRRDETCYRIAGAAA